MARYPSAGQDGMLLYRNTNLPRINRKFYELNPFPTRRESLTWITFFNFVRFMDFVKPKSIPIRGQTSLGRSKLFRMLSEMRLWQYVSLYRLDQLLRITTADLDIIVLKQYHFGKSLVWTDISKQARMQRSMIRSIFGGGRHCHTSQ